MQEHIFNIHDVVLFMTVAECILLALFQAVLPARDRLYGRLLAAFLIVIAASAATTLILWNDAVHTTPVFDQNFLPYFLMAALMLKGPILYLYVASITHNGFSLQPSHLVHLSPALGAFIALAVFGVDSSDLRQLAPEEAQTPGAVVTFLWDAVKLVPFAYALASVVLVHRYRKKLKDEYSHFSTVEPVWLKILAVGFLASWGWSVVVNVSARFVTPNTADSLGIADNYVTFVLINAMFIYTLAYAHQVLATRSEPTRDALEDGPSASAIERVQKIMEVDKIYLEHNLNIENFSNRVGLPVKEVSAVINKHFGTNFFEFINAYRVAEAKALLADPSLSDKTILDILLESGFNSKSAFHRFFKRLVGMSPSEFRRKQLVDQEEVSAV
ncbi:helix-turn-helix domain-containing protein [Marinimicrobium sp. ABcell2]|uniref:helix-turn-helix domain-containing protein n=1 Tax=Marinimicrobium sp. ABcell2 TaxID=3069751 RepID=UPI0027B81C89|nr:AraC family transcriptional regulator [Marinimicrobium sp. ABcell2]MDQ2076613.1 AraC family transcriptional regulator [Marinimicrobium sp. ABcell2]